MPAGWSNKEKNSSWRGSEKVRVAEALSRIPDVLLNADAFNIYRGIRSVDFPNPATNGSTSPRSVVLYDSLFESGRKYDLTRVIVHELAHIYYSKLSDDRAFGYRVKLNWFKYPKREKWSSRKDGFVEEDGRDSPEEDFANNVEYFLFDLKTLKIKTPHAVEWIEENMKDLKMKNGCRYEK